MGASGEVSAEKKQCRQQTYKFHGCLIAKQTREERPLRQTRLASHSSWAEGEATPRKQQRQADRKQQRQADPKQESSRLAGRHGGRQAGRVSGVVGSYDAVEPI